MIVDELLLKNLFNFLKQTPKFLSFFLFFQRPFEWETNKKLTVFFLFKGLVFFSVKQITERMVRERERERERKEKLRQNKKRQTIGNVKERSSFPTFLHG